MLTPSLGGNLPLLITQKACIGKIEKSVIDYENIEVIIARFTTFGKDPMPEYS